jgi:hypothetical protein
MWMPWVSLNSRRAKPKFLEVPKSLFRLSVSGIPLTEYSPKLAFKLEPQFLWSECPQGCCAAAPPAAFMCLTYHPRIVLTTSLLDTLVDEGAVALI